MADLFPKQKIKLGIQRINLSKSTFTRKFRIEIYRMSTFWNFLKTYVTPQYLDKVRKIVKRKV